MWRILLAVVALAPVACARDGAGADRSPDVIDSRGTDLKTLTTGSTLEAIQLTQDAEVLAAVDGFLDSTITVNDPPDPDHHDLGRYRTGPVLEMAVASVRQNQRLGIAYRRPAASQSSHRATVVSLGPDAAVVHACVIDDARQVAMADGRVLNDSTATKLFETRLEVADGLWKVSQNSLLDRWEGVAGCAVSG
jgi:hypothetical protein